MLHLVLFYDTVKKAHSISKQSNKFKQKFNLQDQTNETTICTIQAKEIIRKAKRQGLKQIKRPGKINLCMTDTHNEFNKLMLIKKTPIRGFIALSLKAKTEGFMTNACTRPKPLHQELPKQNNKKWS